jgi:hypothetical protein
MPITTAPSKAGLLSPADPKTVRISREQSASIVLEPGRGVPGSVLLAAMRSRLTPSDLSETFKAFMLAAENHEALSRVINATLTKEELLEAFNAPNRAKLVIGATYSPQKASLTLYTAAFERIEVPTSWFKARPASPPVELSRLAVTDYGQTLRLGEFEVSVDALLADFGPAA